MKVTANGKTFTFPDGTPPEAIGDAVDEYFSSQQISTPKIQASAADVPVFTDQFGAPVQPPQQQAQQQAPQPPKSSFLDAITNLPYDTMGSLNKLAAYPVGAVEAGIAAASRPTTGVLGQMAGFGSQYAKELVGGNLGTQEADARLIQAQQEGGQALTYSPRTQEGQSQLGGINQAVSAVGSIIPEDVKRLAEAAAPMAGELNIIGRGIAPAAPFVRRAVSQEIDLAAPKLPQSKENIDIANRIIAGETSKDLARYKLDPESMSRGVPASKVDEIAVEAMKQGFDDGLVSAIKQTAPINKSKLYQMADIAEKGFNDARFKAENRPIYVAGGSLSKRLDAFRKINKEAGQEIERAAEKIQGEPVNYAPALKKFESDISDFGISIDQDGNLNFSGSDLEFSSGDKKLISNIYSRARKLDGSDAYEVHRLKRLIDRTVDYGKGSSKGITKDGEAVVKSFRAAADDALDSTFDEYNLANTKYADSIRAINNFQDAAGSSVDIFGPNAEKGLGNVSRRLLSNAPSMTNLYTSLGEMDAVAKKYGVKFDDDILTQVMFADALDKRFGSAAGTSLQGDVGKGVRRGIEAATGQRTLSGIGIDAAAAAIEKSKRINEKNAFKSIKDLLSRDLKEKNTTTP